MLEGGQGTPTFSRDKLDFWKFPFDSDAPLRLQVMRYHHQPMRLHRMERHMFVTEGRCPLNGAGGVLIVGGETDAADPTAAPEPEAVRAFLLDGSVGIMFRKGVWHGLDCFPLKPPYADFLFMVDEVTETEIETIGGPTSGRRTHVFDYQAARGITFQVADPEGLLSSAAA